MFTHHAIMMVGPGPPLAARRVCDTL